MLVFNLFFILGVCVWGFCALPGLFVLVFVFAVVSLLLVVVCFSDVTKLCLVPGCMFVAVSSKLSSCGAE